MPSSIDRFRRHVTLLGGIWYRIDGGHLEGRNGDATSAAIDWHYEKARDILSEACLNEADPLPEYLDSPRGKKLAAKWYALERRQHGIPA